MNVLYFLRERTRFIRYFYDNAVIPFQETIYKIDTRKAPFDDPPNTEGDEPPYLEDKNDASDAMDMLGTVCITMLSSWLKLYFEAWEKKLGIRWKHKDRDRAFKHGYLQGYRTCFENVLGQSWSDCSADLSLIEEIVLARNRAQHPEDITTTQVSYSKRDLNKFPRPVFTSELEWRYREYGPGKYLGSPTVYVSSDKLNAAITETEKLVTWLEEHLVAFYSARYAPSAHVHDETL